MNQFNLLQSATNVLQYYSSEGVKRLFEKPIFIIATPRSGSNLLFETLAKHHGYWSIGGESHGIFRAFPHLTAENQAFDSGCLGSQHADQRTADLFRASLLCLLRNNQGQAYLDPKLTDKPASFTLLEKTPRNALNIPFLLEIFPDAKFIFLHRNAQENIASIVEAWKVGLQSGRFVTFNNLPGWDYKRWCLILPPGWKALNGKSLVEIAAFQWSQCNKIAIQALQNINRSRWVSVSYNQLVEEPSLTIKKLLSFSNLPIPESTHLPELKLSRTTVTAPDANKWKKYENEIEAAKDKFQSTVELISTLQSDSSAGNFSRL